MANIKKLFESVIILFLFTGAGIFWMYAYGMVYDATVYQMADNAMYDLPTQWQFAYDYVYDIGDIGFLVGWGIIALGIVVFLLNATRRTTTDETYTTLDQGIYYNNEEF